MSGPTISETYAKLIDEDGLYDNFRPEHRVSAPELRLSPGGSGPQSGPGWSPGWSPGLSPGLRSGPGLYRVSTVALAALCVILLICVIAVSTHKQKKQTSGGEMLPQTDKQKQGLNVSELLSNISRLQQENKELREKLNASEALRSSLAPPLGCPTSWLSFGGSCYLISSQRESWSGAQSDCSNRGAHLAIILSAEEQTFLWNLLPRGHWNCWWFGITDSHTEDVWKWVDGTPLVGGFWEEGEPNNHIDEDCGYILKTEVLSRVAVRSWYDAPCSMSLPFICEKEMS